MDDVIQSVLIEIEEYQKKASSNENELVQHLVELGYLNVQEVQSYELQFLLKKALKVFWEELIVSKLFSAEAIETTKITHVNELELFFLRKIKDLDEGIILSKMPVLSICSLQSRIIHYRLDILGLLTGIVDKPFDHESISNIQKLSNQLNEFDPLITINAVADMEGLTSKFIDCIGKENCLLIFKLPNVKEKLKRFEDKSAFKRTLKEEFERKSDFYRKIKKTVIRKNDEKVDYGFLDDRIKSGVNSFLLRLIQVHQWMDGFYTGLLDSNLGEVSFDSIINSIQLFNEDDEVDNVKSKEVLFHAGKGYFVFNALFFLEKYMMEEQKLDYQDEVINIMNLKLQAASSDEQKKFEYNSTKIIEANLNANDEKVAVKNGLLRRFYYGVKSFFKKVFKIGEKIFKWISDKLEKMFSFLKEFFKKMFVHLKQALHYFTEGVKYILGKNPLVKVTTDNKIIVSKILIDGDSNCLISSNCRNTDIVEYRKETMVTVQSMVFSIKVITTVIKTVQQMLTFLTWPLLLLNIIRSFKEIVAEYKLITT